MPYPSNSPFRFNRRATFPSDRRAKAERLRSIVVLLVLLLLWSLCLGIGLAQATEPRPAEVIAQSSPPEVPSPPGEAGAIGTVDAVPSKYLSGQKLYLENCATCHLGLPPAVLPSQTWQQLLQDSQHYGVNITPLGTPEVQIAWQYLRYFSRPLEEEERTPYRIYQSRYFKVLHPRVKFAQRVNLSSCISCHPGAGKYDFRSLSAEWQNAP